MELDSKEFEEVAATAVRLYADGLRLCKLPRIHMLPFWVVLVIVVMLMLRCHCSVASFATLSELIESTVLCDQGGDAAGLFW